MDECKVVEENVCRIARRYITRIRPELLFGCEIVNDRFRVWFKKFLGDDMIGVSSELDLITLYKHKGSERYLHYFLNRNIIELDQYNKNERNDS